MATKTIFKIRIAAMLVFLGLSMGLTAQNVAITDDDGYNANSAAMLDIKSTTKGMLIPRVALLSVTDPISVT